MKSLINNILSSTMLSLAGLILAGATFAGCDKGVEENEAQRDYIISYLMYDHNPNLIPESSLSNSLDYEPPFYTPYGQYAFRYIADWYNADRQSEAGVEKGSKITITFEMYGFTGTAIDTATLPVYTNDATYEADYIAAGLNTALWDFTPLALTIGQSDILQSIQDGLIGCRNGDYVEIYMSRNVSYSGDVIGLIPEGQSLLFICTINSVE